MSDYGASNGPGLRERKRRATENAIETAAVSIALDDGPDAVTVERICDAAMISRSTFFNYFPSRDAAIYGRRIQLPIGERTDAVLGAWVHDLAVGIVLAVLDAMGSTSVNIDVVRMRVRLYAAHPEVSSRLSWELADARGELSSVVADWLRRHPEHMKSDDADREARVVMALAALTGELLFATWLERADDHMIELGDILAARQQVRAAMAAYNG